MVHSISNTNRRYVVNLDVWVNAKNDDDAENKALEAVNTVDDDDKEGVFEVELVETRRDD